MSDQQGETAPSAILIVEFDAPEPCPIDFLGDTSGLVYFMSFAHMERYGAEHDLARAAAILKRQLRIDMSPLLSFGDARTDDPEEERALAALWQEAAPLAHCCRQLAEAVGREPQLLELTEGFPELGERLKELADMAQWATERGARVRLTYAL